MPATETNDAALQRAAKARLRRARRALDSAQAELYAAVRDASGLGLSLRQVAVEAGLSHPGVIKIVRRPATSEVPSCL